MEILPKHNGYGFISEFFALNWYVFVELTNKKLLPSLYSTIFCGLEKLIEYFNSTVMVVSSNPSAGTLLKTKVSFFLILLCADELLSTSKITTFLLQSKLETEKSEQELNPIPYLK